MLTEDEARKKICPLLISLTGNKCRCRASDCMMWQWIEPVEANAKPEKGRCGLTR